MDRRSEPTASTLGAPGECVHHPFERQAGRTPDAVAVVAGAVELTYRELEERANRLAHALLLRGAGPEVRVGICVDRSAELVVGLLGILKAGAAYVPLDPAYPRERIAATLRDSRAPLLVARDRFRPLLDGYAGTALWLDADRDEVARGSAARPEPRAGSANAAYLIYTSGSTGRPKGVVIEHRSAAALLEWCRETWPAEACRGVLGSTSVTFDMSVFEVFHTLGVGGTLVLAENALELPRLPARERVTLLNTVPSAAAELLRSGGIPASVRVVNLGGEPLPNALAQGLYALGHVDEVWNLYGPTEDTTYSTAWRVERGARTEPPVGRAVPGTGIRLLDAALDPAADGEAGEVYLAGDGLARGYLDRPELTAERFLPDVGPVPGARMYRVGDRGRLLPGGELEYLGRVDHQVKIRGFRVELGEVESVLRACPGVGEAAVAAREDGSGDRRLVAYVTAAEGAPPPDAAALRERLEERLPGYMVPAAWVVLDRLPLLPNGKLDRGALPEPELAPGADYVAPRTATEERLAAIWAEVLGVERAGVHDGFFDLGGHSLRASQVITRVRAAFGVELPMTALFDAPTIAALAERVAAGAGGSPELPPLVPVSRDRHLPLSLSQEAIWFFQKLAPGMQSYNFQAAIRFRGTLDAEALERTLTEIVRRHEVFRTTFPDVDGRPAQVVHPAAPVPLPRLDLRDLAPDERDREVARQMREEFGVPFDLTRLPLVRWRLLRLADDEHLLLQVEHHFVHDGWSFGVFLRELAAIYPAFARGEPSPLPELPIQFADFAAWHREVMQGERARADLAYWKAKLTGADPTLDLPTDHPRPPAMSFRGRALRTRVPPRVARAARAHARRSGATLYMTLLAGFEALLQRYSGQEDFCVGGAVANRSWKETEPLIGMIVNTVAFRAQLGGVRSFGELVAQVRDTTREGYAHKDVHFGQVVEALHPERTLSRLPVYQVAFGSHDSPYPSFDLPGLTLEVEEALSNGSAKFELSAIVMPRAEMRPGAPDDEIEAVWEYSTDLFEAGTVERMIRHYHALLAAVLADPEAGFREVPLLEEAERLRLLEWGRGGAAEAGDEPVHERFARRARLAPDVPAVVHGAASLTYGELDARAGALAGELRGRGVGPETRVGVCLERGVDAIVALLGVLKAGGVYVPLDPAYPAGRLAFMLADSGARLVLTAAPFAALLPAFGGEVVRIDQALSHSGASAIPHSPSPDNLAYVIYTSGSTGAPKGVMVPHGAAARMLPALVRVFEARPGSRVAQTASLSFDASILEIFLALLSGSTLHVADRDTVLSADALGALLREREVDVWMSSPPLLELLAGEELPALRSLGTGGERCPGELAARWSRGRRLANLYGPTETTVYATWHLCREGAAEAPPIGRPEVGTRVYVLDAAGQPVPEGMPGELYVGGAGVSRGYQGRPELTAERFVPDALAGEPGARMYRTGDRVRWLPGGELEFLGRMDEQVKVRGFRIEPGEIEAALLAQPGVRAAVATVREDAPGRRMLAAYAVAEAGVTGAQLREAARGRLPEYMVPAAVVLLDALPLTPAGKVDRRALPAPAEAAEESHAPPRTPVEEVLAGIFEEVLGRERVGAHDDFFELGGHSLMATRVVARIQPAFGVEVPLRALFEAPTVARLAARIEAERGGGDPDARAALAPASRDGPIPLSFAQQRLWFLHQMDPDEVGYNMAFPTRLLGRLDPAVLERALGALVERHESLRTVFLPAAGGAVQLVRPAGRVRLPVVDLAGLAPEARLPAALRLGEEDARRPFDLERGPVVRFALARLAGEEHVLLLNMHHVVSDGWSWGVLFRDLYALYAAFARGEPSPLAPLPVQYADFAVWQRGWLAGDVLRRQLDWWRERLAGAPPVLELPTDRPRPAEVGSGGASVRFHLPAEVSRGLRSLARREGATLYMVARAAADVLLARWSGQEDLVVGSPIANRTRVELDGLIGFFVNTLALRTDASGDPPFTELVGRVREAALGAYAHQDLPFERLVEEIAPERSLSHAPLLQVMFVLQNARGAAARPPAGLRAEPLALGTRAALFDLELELWDEGEEIPGRARFRTDLFDPATIERLCGHFRTLLAAVCAAPGAPLSRLPMLPAEEARAVLAHGSGPARDTAGDAPAHQLFAAQAARTPDATAVRSGGEWLTYAELDARASRLARRLRGHGAGPGATVAVCVERGPGLPAALLAVWKAGGVYLPLDPTHPPERLSFLLRDSGAELVVADPAAVASLPELAAQVVSLDAPSGEEEPDGAGDAGAISHSPSPEDPAYLVYTSGSTGTPKAVLVEHAQLTHTLRGSLDVLGLGPGDVMAALASAAFDISLLELTAPLLAGGSVRVVPGALARDPGALVDACGDVTVLHAVPALARGVVDAVRGGRPLPGLRLLLVGGDAVPPDLLEDAREVLPGARVGVLYGPTEAAIVCAAYAVPTEGGVAGWPLGRPLPGVRLHVCGPRGEILPVGVPGELWISGGGVARGYLGRPELTAEKFVVVDGERAYRSGDRARWRPDGVLEFLGRVDAQVKVRGFRIEPGEVEAVLREQPGVREAVVLAREDRAGERRLVAYVVPRSAAEPAADAGSAAEQVAGWEALFDRTYGEEAAAVDPTLDITGWNSSYTGEPIPPEEMREWVESTVQRVLALGAGRVLEIGCGTGLLLFRVAPRARAYHGTDFSAAALERVRSRLGALPGVTLARHEADDLAAYAGAGFDTVILNSVAQYFPGVDYLLRVVEGAVAAARPGGRIFLGDLRSLPLLGAFHASVELARAPDALPVERLRDRVRTGMAEEQELVVDPALFEALRSRVPRLGRVEVQVKREGHDNEVSRFRYDVVLHLDADPAAAGEPAVHSWSGEDAAALGALAGRAPAGLLVRGVPDARVAAHVRALARITGPDAPPTAGRVRALAAEEPAGGTAPAALFALADATGRAVEVRPGAPGSLDVLVHPAGGVCSFPAEAGEARPWEAYANDPRWGRRMRALVPALRDAARARLPEYMVPSAFVVLETLPLTPNGKVDRASLPAPDSAGAREGRYVAPRTPTEERMAAVWAEVLGTERVGVEASFFDLGGHSLLATEVEARVREEFGVELPLRALFEAPTVAGLSRRVDALRGRTVPAAGVPALVPVPRDGSPLPLSFAQQRLWFLHRMDPGSTAYNLPLALRLRGALRARALERAIGEIVRRHEALRTTFAEVGGEPVQVVHPTAAAELPVLDLSRLPAGAREAEARRLMRAEARRAFDLRRGPLLFTRLLRLAREEHVLVLSMHHVASDGWSMRVFFREVAALYEAFARGGRSPLPEPPVQYADFAAWQRRWLAGDVLERQLAWWRERLAGAPPVLEIPTDRPRSPVPGDRGARVSRTLPREAAERLRGLARGEGATLFMVLLAALDALLARWSGQEDVVVGTPIANRTRREVEALIGFFVNTLTLRTDVSGDPPFRELLGRVRETTLGAYQHQDVPFEKLVEELGVERSLGHTPLFQVMFIVDDGALDPPPFGGIRAEAFAAGVEGVKFDLGFAVTGRDQGLELAITYREELWDAATVERMLCDFGRVLEAAAADPARRVSALAPLDGEERRLLAEWSRSGAAGAPDRCLHELFAEQAARTPHAVALVHEDERVTYAELRRRSGGLAAELARRGVGPDVRVGICVERSPALVAGLLGILEAGGAYVPLDPAYPAERLDFMLRDAGAPVLLTQESLVGRLPAFRGEVVLLDDGAAPSRSRTLAPSHSSSSRSPSPENLAYVIYTSGSTGRPKGTAVPHRAVPGFFWDVDYARFDGRQVLLQHSSTSWDALALELWPALLRGATCVLYPGASAEPALLGEQVRRHGVTTLWLGAAYFNLVVDSCPEILAGVAQVMVGGEALSAPHVRRALELHPGMRLVNGYGPSECTVFAACYPVPADFDAPSVPIGTPVGDRRVYLLDRHLDPVPAGVPGELCIGGPGVARGYVDRPGLTADRFVPDPFADPPGGRLYRSGDRARLRADGLLEFLGRADSQLKIRGFRVEPGEVEAALAGHPGVREAAVVAGRSGAGELRLVGYVTAEPGARLSSAGLRAHLAERMPAYMVPAALVVLDAMPLTPHGKLDRRALPAPGDAAADGEAYAAPRTPAEEVLAAIWADLLGVDRVSADAGFFDLGGHSLLATRAVSRIREAFGVELPLRALFQAPTVAGVAERVEALRRAGLPAPPPVTPTDRSGDLPLSFAQERLWFIDRMQPGSSTYNVPVAFRLRGPLHARALQRALGEIVRRHEALRTTFGEVGGSPVQRVAPPGGFALPLGDLSALGAEARDAEAGRLAAAEAVQPFDLSAGPLFRAALLRLGGEEHALLLSMHHVVSDGWSMGVLFRELSALYEAYRDGRESPLPPLPVQYADHAAWQRRHLRGEVLERQLAYWRERLADAPALLELPTDRLRPPVQSFHGATERMELAAGAVERLRALGRREGATLFMVVLGAFQVLLSRYAGSADVVVGTPVAGRTRGEVEALIGFFVNTLALRVDLEGTGRPGFREVLGRVREATLGAYEHQDLPFEKLVAELQPERSLSHSPLFQVTFTLREGDDGDGLRLPGLEARGGAAELAVAKYDLMLGVTAHAGGLHGVLTYGTELFEPGSARRLLGHLARVLEQVAEDADLRLSEVELLGAEERRRVVEEWNRSEAEPPAELCIHQRFEEQAERTPDAAAVVFRDEALTYAELDRRAGRLADALRGRGVGPEARVGICLERGVELVVAILGVLKAGGAYVPLDPAHPAGRLAFLLEDSAVPVLLTEESLLGRLPAFGGETVRVDGDAALPHSPISALSRSPSPDNAAYVIYTSGSTGRPKGVVVEHRGVLNLLADLQARAPLGPGDRCSVWTSPGFDVSVYEIFAPLLAGATLYVPTEELRLAGGAYLEWLAEKRIRGAYLPPFLLPEYGRWLERHAERARMGRLLVGVEPISEPLLAGIRRSVPGLRVVNGYGPTEATVCSTLYDVPARAGRERTAPIGRAVANTRAYVLDGSGRPCPVGVPGELCLGGVQLARGYLDRPGPTAERFVPDACSGESGARLYRTGDRVRWLPEGELEFLGRMDQQVKVRGYRVEPGEIESVLAEDPAVREAVVVAREGASGLAEDRRLVGYVAAAGDAAPSAAELRERLRGRLPEYMVPSAIVVVGDLPRTPSGKVDRRALPAPEWDAGAEHVAPRTATEEVVAGIWAEVLGVERVGAHDNFFERGGHSLLATRVVSRVAASLGVELPLRALFEAQTVAELAARVDAARRAGEGAAPPPIAAVDRSGPLPLSFAQERLWFLHQLDPRGSGYNMPSPQRVAGPLDRRALERALGALVRRHESLRTTFRPVDGGAVQVVGPPAPARVPVADLSGLAPEAREREARRLAEEDAGRPFDLRHGPLLRMALLRLGAEEHVMLLCMHHVVSDGWSMGVLFRELYALYAAAARGEVPRIPALGVQYGDFAVWQRAWLAGDVLRRQLDWWRERLAGAPPALELPTDRPRSAVAGDRGASVRLRVGAAEVRALRAVARREGATLYMVLRAAADVLLARWSGQEDLVVGSPIAGRTRVELEGLIGFFVNTLALRTDLSGDPAFAGLVGRVREAALGAYAHQDLPFERLVEELQPERSLAHTPLFQVMFALQNAQDAAVPAPPGLRVERFHAAPRTSRFDLELDLFEQGEELAGALRFRTDLFDPSTVERFAAQLRVLLASAGASPEERCSRLRLLPEEEVRVLRTYGSGPAHEMVPGETVPRLLAEQAARTPDAAAVLSGGESLTYAQLELRASRLARLLRGRGVREGAPVAVCLERGAALLVALLAVWKAGGVYLPLDPGHPAERLAFLLRDSGAELVVSEPGVELPEFGGEVLNIDTPHTPEAEGRETLPQNWGRVASLSEPGGGPAVAPDDLAYLVYTSGSTGTPKAVAVEHARLAHTLRASLGVLGLGPGDVVAALASVAFDISLLELLAPLLAGAAVRIVPRDAVRDPAELVRVCADATALHAVPALMRQVAEAARGGDGLPALRLLLVGGDTVPPDLLEALREAFPRAAVRVLYGPTEATIICATYGVPERGGIAGHPLGRPLPGVRLQVRGARGEILPLGVPGELWISGGGVARGYLDRPELTAEKFVVAGGERAYRTGDRARWRADGVLEFLGRLDEQVKVRGFRIEPGEVEAALRGEPGVREAVVLAREDRPGDRRLVAYVVPESADRAARGAGAAEQVSGWATVFDETYGEGEAEGDPTLDLTGWNSSYTGEPIPRGEMREWVERTVERVLALEPRRVLEIGCGTGLLLFRLAPHAREYHGTDFSAVALERVRRRLGALTGVTLARREADDLAAYAGAGYDTVVLNSVAQYFPGVDYLLRVLEGAAAALAPGGRIFVGDVRSLPLLSAFHASVELARAPEELPAAQLRERVRRGVAEEQELAVDPAFFDALRARLPRLGRVEVQVKRGGYDNEVSRFRYDVVLHLDVDPAGAGEAAARDWSGEDEAGVRALFAASAAALLLRGVPDAGTREHVRAAELLAAPDAATADEVRARAAGGAPGIPREALFALGDASGRAVEVRPGAPGTLDVLLHPAGGAAAFPQEPAEERSWESYANDPQWGRRIRALAPALRSALRARLPEYMLPSALVVLEALPLTPNGKVDRQALPVPDTAGARDRAYAPPRSALEEALVGIWQEVLGVERVGIHDSFFELGGHSLLATQLVARIGVLRVEVPVRQVFQTPTVAGLAESVTRTEPTPGAAEMIARVLLKLKTMSPGERTAALRAKQTPVGA